MKIAGIDYPGLDMNVIFGEIPPDGGLSLMQDANLQGGGKVPNALAAAARLGAETSIIGAVGSDRFGRQCAADLEYNGVDTSRLQRRPGRTTLSLCLTDEATRGKRCIEQERTYPSLTPDDLDNDFLRQQDVLLLYQLDETALAAARFAKEHGVCVLADGDEFDQRTQQNLALVDVFILSEYYYNALFPGGDIEENLRSLAAQGPHTVVVTLGKAGCAGVARDGFFRQPTFTEVRVVDTTGAGDVFHGAFAYGLGAGMSAQEAARFSSAVSSIKCSRLGGRTALPTLAGVRHFLQTGKIDPEDFSQREEYYRQAMWQ